METTANKNTATLLQLSALTQYFIPFGNIILPLTIWSVHKNDSGFVDNNGKQAINFHLSVFLYSVILLMISIPLLVYGILSNIDISADGSFENAIENLVEGNIGTITFIGIITTVLFVIFKIAEFVLIIYAAVKNSNGQDYTYPFAIRFLK